METFLAVLLASFALMGGVCLLIIFCSWKSVGGWLPESWPKLVIECIQVISGIATALYGYWSAGSVEDKSKFMPVAVAGCISLAVWKIVQILVDNRVKAWERIDKETLKRIQKESESRTGLLTLFRKFVMLKIKRLLKEITRKDGQSAGMAVLAPDEHLDELLLNIGCYLAERLPSDKADTANFRVGIYVSEDGFMRPLWALNLNNGDYDVFKSFDAHKDFFACDEKGKKKTSHVVKCVNTHRTIIVEDCLDAEKSGEFVFFNANQRSYLRSMLAFYVGPVCDLDGKMKAAAMVIDTDMPGFFRENDRESLDFALREFAHRIRLELLLHANLDKERRQV